MRLRNTSQYPTEEVRKLVKWACAPIDMRRVCINVKNSSGSFAGRAYDYVPSISNAPASSEYLVTLRIGSPERFPLEEHRYPGKSDRFPSYDIRDWREALVFLAAHEAVHIEQFKEGKSHSELRCEMFALKRLREFRAESLQRYPQGIPAPGDQRPDGGLRPGPGPV